METSDLVCPPGDNHFSPLCHDRGMVSFLFGNLPDFVCKCQSIDKIFKRKGALQPLDTILLQDNPFWYLLYILSRLLISNFWRTNSAHLTLHLLQLLILVLILVLHK